MMTALIIDSNVAGVPYFDPLVLPPEFGVDDRA